MSLKYKGKAACCIELLQILSTGRTYNTKELAELLDVNPRNISEYMKELEEVSFGSVGGYYIESVPGRYGGYKLNGNACVPALQLTLEDKNALIDLFNYAMAKNDFINKNGCSVTMGKIFSSLLIDSKSSDGIKSTNKVNSLVDESIIQNHYNLINKAIKEKER